MGMLEFLAKSLTKYPVCCLFLGYKGQKEQIKTADAQLGEGRQGIHFSKLLSYKGQ